MWLSPTLQEEIGAQRGGTLWTVSQGQSWGSYPDLSDLKVPDLQKKDIRGKMGEIGPGPVVQLMVMYPCLFPGFDHCSMVL